MRNWIRYLSPPIVLRSGQTISSLKEAGEFMLTLPMASRQQPHWQETAQSIMQAAHSGASSDLEIAVSRLMHALKTEGAA